MAAIPRRIAPPATRSCGPRFRARHLDGGDAERFDHRRTGWALDGATERPLRGLSQAEAPPLAGGGVRARSVRPARMVWTTGPALLSDDAHRGALSEKCLECHDQRKWKPAPRFSHDSTDYPLTGRHAQVECADCHSSPKLATRRTAAGDLVPAYRDVPHRECSDCHGDPHRGGLGKTCSDCHLTSGFGAINRKAFDHARTRYPLRGRHLTVKCERCHDFSTPTGRRPAFATCGSCHRDPHAGTATLAGKPADCAACHGLGGFITGDVHRGRARGDAVPAGGSSPGGSLRRVPCRARAGRTHRHATRGDYVCRLPLGRPWRPARQPARGERVPRLPRRSWMDADDLRPVPPRERRTAAHRPARRGEVRRMPRSGAEGAPSLARRPGLGEGEGGRRPAGACLRRLPRGSARGAIPVGLRRVPRRRSVQPQHHRRASTREVQLPARGGPPGRSLPRLS